MRESQPCAFDRDKQLINTKSKHQSKHQTDMCFGEQCVRTENELAPILFAMKMAVLEIMAAASDRRQVRMSVAGGGGGVEGCG